MRIRGAAGSESDMRIRGAASCEQSQDLSTDSRPRDPVQNDPRKHSFPSDKSSRSSPVTRSSSTAKDEVKCVDYQKIVQKKDEHIKEQETSISRLTSENRALSSDVERLREDKKQVTEQLEHSENELRQVPYLDPDLKRRRKEFLAVHETHSIHYRQYAELPAGDLTDSTLPLHLTHDLQRITKPPKAADPEIDDLQLLDYPGDFDVRSAVLVTPPERRIQALGHTMAENDWMESRQPVIVSRYLRANPDNETGPWFRPISETRYWSKLMDDPAFVRIADGHAVSFKTLECHAQEIAARPVAVEGCYPQSDRQAFTDQVDQRHWETQRYTNRRFSNDQEESLAALGVSGEAKPVISNVPRNARDRSRSRSPVNGGQPEGRHDYRHREYESYRPSGPSAGETRDGHRDTESLASRDAGMDAERARSANSRFRQSNETRNHGTGGKNKLTKNRQKNLRRQQRRQQWQQQTQRDQSYQDGSDRRDEFRARHGSHYTDDERIRWVGPF